MNSDYLQNVLMSLVDCSRGRISKIDVLNVLNDFKDNIRKTLLKRPAEKDMFIKTYYDILSSIKFELDYLIKEPHMQPNNDIIRLRDRLYADLLFDIQVENEMRKVTGIFNEFLKGITYFSNQIPNSGQPVYHRPGFSCKSRGQKNDECDEKNSNTVKASKKKTIRICYIERLVYDELWIKMMFSSQDLRHVSWLDDTMKAYQTCFSDGNIRIELTMNDDNTVPIILKIFDGDIIEVYERIYDSVNKRYGDTTYCYQYDSNMLVKHKKNTFENNTNYPNT